jgi:thymidylate synthase (FAD)
MSRDNHHLSDSEPPSIGEKDFELIQRIGNKLKHKSVLEQIVLFFEIDGISRACLQELARHRTERMVVQSTRYVLHKKLKNEDPFFEYREDGGIVEVGDVYDRASKYVVFTENKEVDYAILQSLEYLRAIIEENISNDIAKYALPEAFKVKLQWQIDMRNFQSFLELRTSKEALWEIRDLALNLFYALPDKYRKLCEEYVKE